MGSVCLPQLLISLQLLVLQQCLSHTKSQPKAPLGDENTQVWRGRLERKGDAVGLCPVLSDPPRLHLAVLPWYCWI